MDDAEQQRILNNAMQRSIPESERPQVREMSPIVVIALVWLVIAPLACVGLIWLSSVGSP